VERHGRWHIAYCPEIPGANGQGKKKAAALKSLRDAIALMCLLLAADPIPRG
jgi:predicted RNase H-like HicB family nuclease